MKGLVFSGYPGAVRDCSSSAGPGFAHREGHCGPVPDSRHHADPRATVDGVPVNAERCALTEVE